MSDAGTIRFAEPNATTLHRLTFDPARDPAFTAALADILGAALPAPGMPSGRDPMLVWQGPHDFLIEGLGGALPALEAAVSGRAALLGDAAAGLVAIDLVGQGLQHRLDHDRPAGGRSRVMRFAALRVTVLWYDEAAPRVRLLVDRSHAGYLRCWLEDRWLVGREEA